MTAEQQRKRIPITRILIVLFFLLTIPVAVGVFLYLDFNAGSSSMSTCPNGMMVSAVARGFGGGGTAIGQTVSPQSHITHAEVRGQQFDVTDTQVVLNREVVAQIPAGTKQLSIIYYRGSITIEADGARIGTVD